MSLSAVKKPHSKLGKFRVQWIAKVSVMAAIAFVVMMFEIPLPFAPSFYKLGLDESVILLTGFALGPWAAVAAEALKILLNLLFQGTVTAGVGELMNFVIGLCYVLPASLYYKFHKTKKGAIIALALGTLVLTIGGTAANYFIALPMYSFFYGIPLDALISMGTAINPLITNKLTFCLLAVLPFNLLKGIVNSLLTALVYKRVSAILKR